VAEVLILIFLAFLWVVLTGELTPFNVLVGALLGILFLSVVRRDRERSFPKRLFGVVRFLFSFLLELITANITVALLAIRPHPRFHPHIIAVPLRIQSDGAISLLSATITLLPGTVAMGVSNDKRTLYAHAIGEAEAERSRQSVVRIETLILRFMV